MGDKAQWSSGVGVLWDRLRQKVGEDVGLNQALLFLAEEYPEMLQQVCLAPGLDRVREQAKQALAGGERGAGLSLDTLATPAGRWARERGKDRAYERDLIAAVLELAGLSVRPTAPGAAPARGPAFVPGMPSGEGKTTPDRMAAEPSEPEPAATPAWRPQTAAPQLESLGRDLTAEAASGGLPPILGRDRELELVVETLCRPSKPNPLLLGPAGVGKTAIVEALAQRVVSGQVPAPLKDVRLFALQTSDLVQGMGVVGELDKRMREVVTEAEQPGLIVFLDEIHTVVGAGAGGRSANDMANILKPALSRGKMLCIGATTDGEYTRHLSGDAAFERRFQVVRVQELEPAATRAAIEARAAAFGQRSGVAVDGEALDAIIALSGRYLRHRRFPDKAIDILDQSLARAVVLGLERCDADLVREVVARVVGLPVTAAERDRRLDRLASEMVERAGIRAEDADRVVRRLRVTMANLDLRPGRPNLVVAVPGLARAARLAQVLAEVLLGDGARVVEEDFSSYTHPGDVTRLIGAAPGYVGHDQEPRLHLQLRQQPWSVVLLRAVDCAHPAVQGVLGKALSEGVLRDARGEDTSWADCLSVVGLAAGAAEGLQPHTVGFLTPADGGAQVGPPASELDPALLGCLDLTCGPEGLRAAPPPRWVASQLLAPLAARWHHETGSMLAWGEGFEHWVAARAEEHHLEGAGLERWFEEQVVAAVAVAATTSPGARTLSVGVGAGGEVVVTANDEPTEPGPEPEPAR